MADIKVRNFDDTKYEKIKKLAHKNNMSINQYLKVVIERAILEKDILELDRKYKDSIYKLNNIVVEQNSDINKKLDILINDISSKK